MDDAITKSFSVIIPVYNSQNTLSFLITRLEKVLTATSKSYEVILVNDCSLDDSWSVICEMSHKFSWIKGINLMRNFGQHNALLCGIRQAKYDAIITMDDDLQHPPEEIPKLIDKLNEGFDVVYGSPNKLPHSLIRNVLSLITKRVLALVMRIRRVRDISAFRIFRTRLRNAFDRYQNPGVILDVLLSWGTTRFASVKVDEFPRMDGKSNYSFSKLVSTTFLILTGFSTAPLKFASWLGFSFTLFGLVIFLYVLIAYITAGSIPGFPFLASIISIFSGIQLFTLGIFGEYLGRIFTRNMERPVYVINHLVENGKVRTQD